MNQGPTQAVRRVYSHFRHPLASHPFSNSSAENFCTAHVRARVRIATSSSADSVSTVRNASANVSGVVAWNPVGSPSNGTTMSSSGPPDACATTIAPAAYKTSKS